VTGRRTDLNLRKQATPLTVNLLKHHGNTECQANKYWLLKKK
jgi:hypothetical protein